MATEPWQCGFCKQMMYNTELRKGKVYPIEGAPNPKFFSNKFPIVCTLCFSILISEVSQYWSMVAAEEDKKSQNNKRLKPGSDYYQS